VTLDPVLALTLRTFFGGLFVLAATHKAVEFRAFSITLQRYTQDSPLADARCAAVLGVVVIGLEFATACACALGEEWLAATAVATLLFIYASAMYVNLRRGRVLLDCGCSWGDRRQPISYGLVARNVVLMAAASLLCLPQEARALTVPDFVAIVAAVTCAAALYSSANQLLAVNGQLGEAR
jgi:hypothetical protein